MEKMCSLWRLLRGAAWGWLLLLWALPAAGQQNLSSLTVYANVFQTNCAAAPCPASGAITTAQASTPLNNVGQAGNFIVVEFTTAVADVNNIQVRIEVSYTCGTPVNAGCTNAPWLPTSEDITTAKFSTSAGFAYAVVKANGAFPFIRINSLKATPGAIPMIVRYTGEPFPVGDVFFDVLCQCWVVNPPGTVEHVVTFIVNGVGGGGVITGLTGSGTIDFPSINDGACADGTFPLVGAVAGDKIAPGWPLVVPGAAGMFGTMEVSAGDTITVRMCNLSGGAVDLASATYAATDLQGGGGGGGGVIAPGDAGIYPSVEYFGGTVTRVSISTNVACSAVVSFNKLNGGIPTGANKISGTGPATLVASQLNQNAADLTKWTTLQTSPQDVWGANVDSVAGCNTIMVQVWIQ